MSFVEATPRYDKKHKLALSIELTDFSVYYTQGAAEAAIAAMKEGKSEVMCEQGQLFKVSKNKEGIVKKEQYEALDGLGGLLGGGFRLHEPQGNHQGAGGTGLSGISSLPALNRRRANWPCRLRGTLDRRLHLRERMAELPHSAEPRAGADDAAHTYARPAATPSRSRSSTFSATTR